MDVRKKVAALIKRHGSLRKAALAIDMDCGQLSRLYNNKQPNPTMATLRKLGMVK